MYLEIINACNRDNIGFYELEIKERDDESGFDIAYEANTLLPIIPSLGLSWQF